MTEQGKLLENRASRIACALFVFAFISGCDFSPSSPNQLPPANGDTPAGEAPDENPTQDSKAISRLVLSSAIASAAAAGVTLPVSDLQLIFEAGLPPPICPALDADLVGRDLDLTLDYGVGCKSSHFHQTPMRGMVRGVYYTAYNAFDLLFEDVAVNEQSLSGAVTGRLDVVDGIRQTTLNVNLTFQDITTRGTVVAWLGSESMWLSGTDLTVTDSEGVSCLVTLNEVGVGVVSNPSLSPHEGSAQGMFASMDSSAQTIIRFTSDTPISGHVKVQSNSE